MPITGDLADLSPHDLCKEYELDLSLFGLNIELPVGFKLELEGPVIPFPGDVSGRLLGKVNAALAPLSPFFDVLDLLLAFKDLFEAFASLNPFKIAGVLPKVLAKIDKLKKLIPVLSMPASIKSIVKVLIVYVTGMRTQIQLIIEAQSSIDLSAARALKFGAPDLTIAVGCAQANVNFQLDLLRNDAAPLNRLIAAVNVFCDLAQLPHLPPVTIAPGAAAADIVEPLTVTIDALQSFHDALPG